MPPTATRSPGRLCVFEFIYFARPDSVIDGCSVTQARQQAGAFLAKEHPVEADVVVGVPDSGLDAALGYASASGIPYAPGIHQKQVCGPYLFGPHPIPAGGWRQFQVESHSFRSEGEAGGTGG